MMQRNIYRSMLVLILLVAATLSCNFIMSPVNEAVGFKNTAESIATEVDIEGMVTEIDVEAISTQIEGIATEFENEGLLETMQAETTSIPGLSGERPEDIPVMEGEKTALVESSELVTYMVNSKFQEVVDFYETQMPSNGWSKVAAESEVGEDNAKLVFQKGERKATVNIFTIPFVDQTTVEIDIKG